MLPAKLVNMLDEAIESVSSHPKGELILPIRKEIWGQFGNDKIADDHQTIQSNGLKRQIKLAVLCVEHVMPIWDAIAPTDKRPSEMIKLIDDYFNEKIDWDSLWNIQNDFSNDLENLTSKDEYSVAISIVFASINAVTIVLRDERCDEIDDFDETEEEKDILDEDLDPYSWDASFFASVAYSGGAPWEAKSSISKRQEFWMWYLKKAVPQAYEAFKSGN